MMKRSVRGNGFNVYGKSLVCQHFVTSVSFLFSLQDFLVSLTRRAVVLFFFLMLWRQV